MERKSICLYIFSCIFCFSCIREVNYSSLEIYDGPISEVTNILMIQSDSAIIRTEVQAAKQLEFKNGDMEYPEGITIKFYTKEGELESFIRADRGYFTKKENLYKGEGNVIVENLIEDQYLKSEELFWDRIAEKIFTDKFVLVREKGKIIYGTGLESDERFSNYSIKNPTGNLPVPGE